MGLIKKIIKMHMEVLEEVEKQHKGRRRIRMIGDEEFINDYKESENRIENIRKAISRK